MEEQWSITKNKPNQLVFRKCSTNSKIVGNNTNSSKKLIYGKSLKCIQTNLTEYLKPGNKGKISPTSRKGKSLIKVPTKKCSVKLSRCAAELDETTFFKTETRPIPGLVNISRPRRDQDQCFTKFSRPKRDRDI